MEGMEASPERMQEAADFAADRADAIETELSRLDRGVTDLLGEGWQGRAASVYEEGWSEWKHGATEIVAALRDSSALLAAQAGAYQHQDKVTGAVLLNIDNRG